MDPKLDVRTSEPSDQSYEAPDVEAVLAPEQVEREVHYAGEQTPIAG